MANLPRWSPTVCSDYNLAAFQRWLPKQDPAEAAKYLDLYVIAHDDPPVPAFIRSLLDSDVYNIWPRVQVDGQDILLPRRPRAQQGCSRCGVQGGYKFQWLGPWTCQASIRPNVATAHSARQIWMACSSCTACITRRVTSSISCKHNYDSTAGR